MKKTNKYILMSALTALALGGVCYISTKDYSPIIGNEGKDNEQYILLHKTAQIADSIDISGALTSKVSKPYLDYVANEDGTFNVRFISGFSVDNYDNNATTIPYLDMGFNINYKYSATTHDFSSTVDRVFKSVIINNKTYNKENMSSLFNDGNSYDYLLVKSLLNIPTDGLNTILNVSPFIVGSDNQLYTSSKSLSNSIYGDLFDNNTNYDSTTSNVKIEFEDFALGGSAFATSKDTSVYKNTRHYLAKLGGRYAASPYGTEETSSLGKLINPTGDFVMGFDGNSTMTYNYHSDYEGYADIIIRGASNNNKQNYSIDKLNLANAFKLTINDEDFNISPYASFLNKKDEVADDTVNIVGKDIDGDGVDDVELDLNGRYMMQTWQSVNIGKVNIVKGDNVFKFTANNGNQSGQYDYMELDFDKYKNKDVIEFEDCELVKASSSSGLVKVSEYSGGSKELVKDFLNYNGIYGASGHDFVKYMGVGDKVIAKVNSTKDQVAKLAIRASSLSIDGTKFITNDTIANQKIKLSVNDENVDIVSSAVFEGRNDGKLNEDGKTYTLLDPDQVSHGLPYSYGYISDNYKVRYLYNLFRTVTLCEVNLKEGENTIVFEGLANDTLHLDYLSLEYPTSTKVIDETIKLEAEDFTLTQGGNNTISKSADANSYWPYAYSSPAVATSWDENGLVTDNSRNGYYVGNVREGDKMAHSFVSSKNGYLNYSIAGSSNYVLKASSSSQSVPSETGDMYLNKVMTVKVNGIPVTINQDAKFNGGKDSDRGRTDGDRSLFTNYILTSLMKLNVREGQTYNIEYTFIHEANYTDAYTNKVCGNYDYVTLDYYHYAAK